MQARVKKTSRYGVANLFSGHEFVKFEWRKVPEGFEEQARTNDLLEVREGKAEKEVVEKQVQEAVRPVMKARLVADHRDETIRAMGGHEYVKTEWREVPAGFEESAKKHDLLQVWEPGTEEPKQKAERKHVAYSRKVKPVIDDGEGGE